MISNNEQHDNVIINCFRMLSLPAEPAKIDWAMYKNKIAVPGLVDSFEKSYNAIKIPYPEDKYSGAIDKYEKDIVITINISRLRICYDI